MSCKCAKPTDEWHGWECEVTGGACMFYMPDSKKCAEIYGEGPDAYPDEKCENCKGFKMMDGKRLCVSTWGRSRFEQTLDDGTAIIDEDTICCGGFEKNE